MLQPTVEYRRLAVTGRRREKETDGSYCLHGLCYSDGCLYVVDECDVESGGASLILSVYRVQGDSEDITLLDRMTLRTGAYSWTPSVCPRVDRHSRRVFVHCWDNGVSVAHLHGDRLVREKTLTCVRVTVSVDVMSPDTVYVSDGSSHSVRVVDVRDDRITSTLEKPDTVKGERPSSLAVLGDSVMVCYGRDLTLVIYRHGRPAPSKVIPQPGGLKSVFAVSTDWHSNFLVTDTLTVKETNPVFVIDISGNVRHTVNIDSDSWPRDCAVVNRQLWVGCYNGDIVIMSSQS